MGFTVGKLDFKKKKLAEKEANRIIETLGNFEPGSEDYEKIVENLDHFTKFLDVEKKDKTVAASVVSTILTLSCQIGVTGLFMWFTKTDIAPNWFRPLQMIKGK